MWFCYGFSHIFADGTQYMEFPADFLLRWATLGIATGLGGAFGIRRTQKELKLLSWREVQNLPIKTDNPDV